VQKKNYMGNKMCSIHPPQIEEDKWDKSVLWPRLNCSQYKYDKNGTEVKNRILSSSQFKDLVSMMPVTQLFFTDVQIYINNIQFAFQCISVFEGTIIYHKI
jgi:hypothetical protein